MTLAQFLKLLQLASSFRKFHYGLTFFIDYDGRLVPRRKFRLTILCRSDSKPTETPRRPLDVIEAVYFYLISVNALPTRTCSHPLAAAAIIKLNQETAEAVICAANQTQNYSRALRSRLVAACGLTNKDKAKVLSAYFGSVEAANSYAQRSLREEEFNHVSSLSCEDTTGSVERSSSGVLQQSMRASRLVRAGKKLRITIHKSKRRKIRPREDSVL